MDTKRPSGEEGLMSERGQAALESIIPRGGGEAARNLLTAKWGNQFTRWQGREEMTNFRKTEAPRGGAPERYLKAVL